MNNSVSSPSRYRWFVVGDISGFFGLMIDNVTVLSFFAGILIVAFNFPADIVYGRMIPGTAFGVLVGDLAYTWLAFRLARSKGNSTVTAMPLGLDTPSTIGIALTVLGPAFITLKSAGMPERDAALMTWYIGMATMVMIGIVKVAFSFCGGWVQKIVPQAGLLGSLAGIGLALIGMIPLLDVFAMPIVGLVALGIVFYSLVAGIKLPWRIPGVLGAVVVGTALYYVLGPFGLVGGSYAGFASPELHAGLPLPTLDFVTGFLPALKYLPIAIPFGILTIVGGINTTESARVAGDEYSTRDILLTEALATLAAGVMGGVAQTTPYIGQPAYKRMGARAGYTLLTGVFIGVGGALGVLSFIIAVIPRAVLAPILVFVALDITAQSFRACPARHAAAVAFAFFPTIARLLTIKLSAPEIMSPAALDQLLSIPGKTLPEMLVTVAMGNGFIITAMLWGAFLAEMIDRRLLRSSIYLFVLALLSFFGIIHSAMPDGAMYLPWKLSGLQHQIPFQFGLAYGVLALLVWGLSFSREGKHSQVATG